MKKAVKYIRVSTVEQNESRQTDLSLVNVVDRCSGSIAFNKRKEGSKLLKQIKNGLISEVHVHTIDRLGRDVSDILNTIKECTSNNVCVYSSKEGLRSLNEDGTPNIMANLMIGILGSIAQFELVRIKERQAEGIAKAKARNGYIAVGREMGSKEDISVFLAKEKNSYIMKLLKKGETIRGAARKGTEKFGKCSPALVRKVLTYVE